MNNYVSFYRMGIDLRIFFPLFLSVMLLAITIVEGQAAKGIPGKDAAYVVDANTGKILYSRASDKARYPASLTKVMTIYIMLEEIDAGRLSLKTRIPMTKRGVAQEPSKLGMKIGQTISVSDAIKALIVKSANDVAVAVFFNDTATTEIYTS